MIDLVVPFVDSKDQNWRALYTAYIHNSDLDSGRFRDTGLFKYFFRSLEKNLPWIDNIYLIVQSRSQVPSWLNLKHPKLKVVLHEDYIPKEYLPTFNSITICSLLHLLKPLSNQFILADDDMIFVNPKRPEDFFRDGRPVTKKQILTKDYKRESGIWQSIIYNSVKLFNQVCNTKKMIRYKDWHLPMVFCKSYIFECWSRFGHYLRDVLISSKIRKSCNYCEWIFNYCQMYEGFSIDDQSINTNGYLGLEDNTSKEDIERIFESSDIVCLNDRCSKGVSRVFSYAEEILSELYPDKCEFEI